MPYTSDPDEPVPVRIEIDAAEFVAGVEAATAAIAALSGPTDAPDPDEYGRLRVRDEDTGHELSIHAAALPHGNFTVLSEDASDVGGNALPVKHHKSAVESTTSGQSADPSKEK